MLSRRGRALNFIAFSDTGLPFNGLEIVYDLDTGARAHHPDAMLSADEL